VKEQEDPDPEFTTVDFPNPEEGASALDLSFKTADSVGAVYILANDPDADRLGVAQKKEANGWHILSGNEIGALLGWWLIHTYKYVCKMCSNSDVGSGLFWIHLQKFRI
jgi:phosphomannomutase